MICRGDQRTMSQEWAGIAQKLYQKAIFKKLTHSMYVFACVYLFIILHHNKSQLAFFEVQASDFGPEID